MKKRLDELTAVLAEDSKMTKLDVVLSILVALFTGIFLGMLLSPRKNKTQYFGCGNGNNYAADDECEGCDCNSCGDCECEGGLCCKTDCDEERCCGEHEFCGNQELCCEDDLTLEEEDEADKKERKSYFRIR